MIEVIDRILGWICNNLDDMIMFAVGTMFTGVLAWWHGFGLKKKLNKLQDQNSELLENNREILSMMRDMRGKTPDEQKKIIEIAAELTIELSTGRPEVSVEPGIAKPKSWYRKFSELCQNS